MLVYDTILTFPLELEKIWKQKTTGVTVLWFFVSFAGSLDVAMSPNQCFIQNRWFFLAAVVPTIASEQIGYLTALRIRI